MRHNKSGLAQHLLRQLCDLHACASMYMIQNCKYVYSRTFSFQLKISLRRYYWWINLNKQIFNFGEISPQWDLFTKKYIFYKYNLWFHLCSIYFFIQISFLKVAYIYFWLLKYLKKCLPYCTTVHGQNWSWASIVFETISNQFKIIIKEIFFF